MGISDLENSANKKYNNQLRTFLRILHEFPQEGQLTHFLPGYFRTNKQMGSNDRKMASRLMYNYFRLGKAISESSAEQRLLVSEFLCNTHFSPFLDALAPDLNKEITLPINEKIAFLKTVFEHFNERDIFPFSHHLSEGVDVEDFIASHLKQPDLFIRLYARNASVAKQHLQQYGLAYEEISELCLRLPNGTKLDTIFKKESGERYFEVQDLSSQKTGEYFEPKQYEYWWDCCAASGGKSLLLNEQAKDLKLLVSDIRDSILDNLETRFREAGVRKYQRKQLDLTINQDLYLANYSFDGIILDAPCTGSGTWGRTPELISSFNEKNIKTFQRIQRNIATNVVKYLKPGKPLIYLTCSAFKEENEENVAYIASNLGFETEKMGVIKGYNDGADTMFAARLIKK